MAWRTRATASMALAGSLACLAGVVAPFAQEPTFRSGVEVVLIDVSIVDRSGQPVSDLLPSQFHVTVDRKPRQIVSAQFLAHAMRLAARPAAAASSSSRASAPPAGRDILIVVDEDSLDGGNGLVARRAAEQFVERLAPADRAGVATIPRLRGTISLSTNRSDVRKAIRQINAGRADDATGTYWIGVAEALDIERNDQYAIKKVVDRECRGSYPERIDRHCVDDVLQEAHVLAMLTRQRSQRSIDALQQLADGLKQVDGPKTLVLVSGGVPLPESTQALTRLAASMARGQATLYTIFIESPAQSADKVRRSPTFLDDDRVEAEGIENITSAAGGSVIHAIGTVESCFDRVATELSGSYLLGIEVAPADRDGNTHVVNVKVDRPGVEVRARSQYVIPKPALPKAGVVTAESRAPARAQPRTREVEVTPPEVEAVVARAAEYVTEYEARFSGLVAEERFEQKQFKWKSRGGVTLGRELVQRGEWSVDATRVLRSDYLLVKAPEVAGWIPFRDVFEVDGHTVRERDQRLQKLFLETPNSAWERANEILNESARFNIGYTRNTNLPTLALMFLHPAHRAGFVFRKAGEGKVEGVPVWEVGYREHARPTLVQNGGDDLPAEGTFWIDPAGGRVLRTALRLKASGGSVEILVTYRQNERLGDLWVPTEMRETSSTAEWKLECVGEYSNFRRFQVTTDVQIPK